jgi:type IV secretion system protein VirD4
LIKGIILGVLLTLAGLTILVFSLIGGSFVGGYFGVILILLVVVPAGMLIIHRYAMHMPAYVTGSYNLVASILLWVILMAATMNTPEGLILDHGAVITFLWSVRIIATCLVLINLTVLISLSFPQFNKYLHKNAEYFGTPVLFPILAALGSGIMIVSDGFRANVNEPAIWIFSSMVFPALGIAAIAAIPRAIMKWTENKGFREFTSSGRGGSARWAGPETLNKVKWAFKKEHFTWHRKNEEKNGTILLGETLPQDTTEPHYVAITDDAHMVTIGMTGAGKSTAALFNNLPIYKGDILAVDPKGELAEYAAAQRNNWLSNSVFVLDPFGVVDIHPSYKAAYNPLADIDIHSDNAMRFLRGITEACVIHEGEKNIHFTETAENFIQGLIAHILSTRPEHQQNLPYVYDMLIGMEKIVETPSANGSDHFEDLLEEMSKNRVCGGIAVQGADFVRKLGNDAYGALLSTTIRSLKWIGDPPMRRQLAPAAEDRKLSLRHLGNAPVKQSVFIVLPFDYLPVQSQGRWLRLLINFGLSCVQILPEPPKPQVLFIVDEFYSLGHFKKIENSIVQLRSAGVKLWIFIQNIGQLKEHYKDNWEGFTGSANTQVLAVQDSTTAEWVSNQVGDNRNGGALITPSEVIDRVRKERRRQIVLPVNGFPMQLANVFYEDFVPEKYRAPANSKAHWYAGENKRLKKIDPAHAPTSQTATSTRPKPKLNDEIEQLVEEWGYEGNDVPVKLTELSTRYAERKKLFPSSMHKVLDEQYTLLKSVFFS